MRKWIPVVHFFVAKRVTQAEFIQIESFERKLVSRLLLTEVSYQAPLLLVRTDLCHEYALNIWIALHLGGLVRN